MPFGCPHTLFPAASSSHIEHFDPFEGAQKKEEEKCT